MFIISSLAVLILAFAAVYFITADLVRPLRKMVAATQSFSKGDFTVRVPVESYDEIGQLAISFNNMATSLATTEVARRSFTANVSHELRTPMTTIAGFIDGILDGTIPPEKRDDYLKIVSEEIKRLLAARALDAQHRPHRGGRTGAEARPLRRERHGHPHRLYL